MEHIAAAVPTVDVASLCMIVDFEKIVSVSEELK